MTFVNLISTFMFYIIFLVTYPDLKWSKNTIADDIITGYARQKAEVMTKF